MRIIITGSRGQLGSALHQLRPEANSLALADLDITNRQAAFEVCQRIRPELIVHCAAWTAVNDAARQPEMAYRVNALGTQNLVLAALEHNTAFAYVGTNEVFDDEENAVLEIRLAQSDQCLRRVQMGWRENRATAFAAILHYPDILADREAGA